MQQSPLRAAGIVEGRVGQRDVGDPLLEQPRTQLLGADRQTGPVEDRVARVVELSLPAPRQRHVRSEVRGLPVIRRGHHLDARRVRFIADAKALQLGQEGRVVGAMDRRVRGGRREVRRRRVGLPVQQWRRQREQHPRPPPAAHASRERARCHGPGDERAETVDVPSQRGLCDVGGDERARIQQGAGGEHPGARAP